MTHTKSLFRPVVIGLFIFFAGMALFLLDGGWETVTTPEFGAKWILAVLSLGGAIAGFGAMQIEKSLLREKQYENDLGEPQRVSYRKRRNKSIVVATLGSSITAAIAILLLGWRQLDSYEWPLGLSIAALVIIWLLYYYVVWVVSKVLEKP